MNNAIIVFEKEHLKTILLCYDEKELSEKVDKLSDNDLKEIGYLAFKYVGHCNLIDKTIAYGAIEFFEGTHRELKRKKRIMKYYHVNNKNNIQKNDNIQNDFGLFDKIKSILGKRITKSK